MIHTATKGDVTKHDAVLDAPMLRTLAYVDHAHYQIALRADAARKGHMPSHTPYEE